MNFPAFAIIAAGLFLQANCLTDSLVHVSEMTIIPKEREGIQSSLGYVYGAKPCGGPGQLVNWRVEGCDTTDSPCKIPADGELRRSEVDFIPSEDIEQLGIRLIFTVEGKPPKVVYENPVKNSTVKANEKYTSVGSAGVSKEVKGKMLNVQYILYRDDEEKATELCAVADFEMV